MSNLTPLDQLISSIKTSSNQGTNITKSQRRTLKTQNSLSSEVILVEEDQQRKLKVLQKANKKNKQDQNDFEKTQNSENIFLGKLFTFISFGFKLPSKRVDILSQNIEKKGGIVVPSSQFIWNSSINGDITIMTSDEITYESLEEIVPAIFHHEIMRFTFMDCEWITKCLQKDKWINPANYFLKLQDPASAIVSSKDLKVLPKETEAKVTEKVQTNESLMNKKFEKSLDEKKMEVQSLQSNLVNNQVERPATIQKENNDIYKPYAYLFDYLYEPTQIQFNEEDSSTQTALFEHESSSQSIKNFEEHKIEEIKEETQCEEKSTDEQEEEKSQIIFNEKFELLESEDKQEENSTYLTKKEITNYMNLKDENKVKNEYKIKREYAVKSEGAQTREFMYVLSDEDDEVIYSGTTKKKVKLENNDVKGTFLEGLMELDKINTDKNGDLVELKDFKAYNPSKRQMVDKQNHDISKHQKDTVLLCQPESKTNLNSHITDELEKMLKIYEIQKDKGRVYAYGKAISILKALPKKIESVNDVTNITGIGSSLVSKIKEILITGKLRKVESLNSDEKMTVLEMFDEIHGVGPVTALQFFNKGFRTIEDLRKNQHILNESQKIGLKYYEEFKQKIPRDFVTEIFNFVVSKIDELSDYKGQFECICGGSYRRGRPYCGDVDIIMSPKDGKSASGFCMKLVKSLEGYFLTDHLTLPSSGYYGADTYLGVCYFKGRHRRIDFKVCDRERFGPLTIFYTGGDYFNRSMRIYATKNGYHLENYGLYPAVKAGGSKYSLQLIPCYTEHDVFRILGLKYIPPEERDI